MARSVARSVEADGLGAVLKLAVPIELPPVGIITLRGRRVTPGAAQLIDALREATRMCVDGGSASVRRFRS
jgi:DNA-binding transcriptional LysR family regulator